MPQTVGARNRPRLSATLTFLFPRAPAIYAPMKATLATLLLAGVSLVFIGCESDLPPASDVGNRFQRGVTGQGTLVQPDRSEDPLIQENTRVGY